MPAVRTLTEEGFPDLDACAWWGLYAPAGIPKPILDRLHAEAVKVLPSPEVKQQRAAQPGMQIVADTPDALRTFVDGEMAKWRRIIRDDGIRLD